MRRRSEQPGTSSIIEIGSGPRAVQTTVSSKLPAPRWGTISAPYHYSDLAFDETLGQADLRYDNLHFSDRRGLSPLGFRADS